ncbi:hypothetical protein ACOGYP_000385 [Edwardsiella piscicida]|nr:hypothetical protein [Edwardsiella piscicida]
MAILKRKSSSGIISSIRHAEDAIRQLLAQGVDVVGVSVKGGTPVINISRCHVCDKLIREGKAAYVKFGNSHSGMYRQGVFKSHGCRVVWSERLI